MRTLTVRLGSRSYPIHIGDGILGDIGRYVSGYGRAAVVSDENVWRLYGERLSASLGGISFSTVILPPGEQSKSIDTLKAVYSHFVESNLKRDSLVIAFGGGVIGDLTGFAAATYMRGIDYMQVPTTLLAQVDSSVGGKTAVNLPLGKNLVGAFHQPVCVLSDTSLLSTLDERNYRCGMAEVIKHGVLDEAFFSLLEANPSIDEIVYWNCDIKRKVVESDERERGNRMKLNLGHTFGHAIEKLGNFEKYNHGEAVAAGMLIATRYGEKLGITNLGAIKRLETLMARFGLDIEVDFDLGALVPLMANDKKNEENSLNLILIKDIGDVVIYKAPFGELERALLGK